VATSAAGDRPRVGISRCLLGDEVRYDGGHKREPLLVETLGPLVEWVPVCPEMETGMGTPREPIHLVASPDGVFSGEHRVRLLGVRSGRDWTQAMDTWLGPAIAELGRSNLSGFILKADSPSCGIEGVAVNTGEAVSRSGRGLFAHALVEAFPDLPIEDEIRLRGREVRDAFISRVRAYHDGHRPLRKRE
jgi:uncharacterized protein YbbK (DUF523 family)